VRPYNVALFVYRLPVDPPGTPNTSDLSASDAPAAAQPI
jgi:hypothetical protein